MDVSEYKYICQDCQGEYSREAYMLLAEQWPPRCSCGSMKWIIKSHA